MRLAIVLMSLQMVWAAVESAAEEERESTTVLFIGVERSLPVRDQQCRIWVVIAAAQKGIKITRAEVEFSLQWDGEEIQCLARKSIPWAVGESSTRAEVTWTPKRVGACRVLASAVLSTAEVNAVQIEASPVDVFVATRRLHFNYWGCTQDQRYVTSVMDNSKEGDSPKRWRRRGVLPLAWKGGHWLWRQKGFSQTEKVVENWLSMPEGRVGVMIDEFGGGGDVDEQLGQALLLTRQRSPDSFLAPYCVGVSGDKMIEGLRQADLILVETYTSDWRGDGAIIGRWETAAKAGLTDRSIAVLGVGHKWTTTEKELRRIFDMVRAVCPEMPGLGFFPNVPARLTQATDAAIEDYFLRPVLTVSVQDKAVVLRNVGETPAVDVKIAFLGSARKLMKEGKTIPLLDSWTTARVQLPPAATGAELIPAPDRYTTLRYTRPLEQPKPDDQARAAALAFRRSVTTGQMIDPLARSEEMRLQRSDTKHKNSAYHRNIRAATIPIPSSEGRPVALTFDLRLRRAWFYGANTISLAGKGTLSLGWSHNDHDAGLKGDQPRPALSFTGVDDYTVRDVPVMGFSRGKKYHVLLAYDGRSAVRAMVTDQSDALLWDSGPVPASGGFECHELRLGVGAFQGSDIRRDPEKGEIFLRGVSGGPIPSPYVLESTLSNFRLFLGSAAEGAR